MHLAELTQLSQCDFVLSEIQSIFFSQCLNIGLEDLLSYLDGIRWNAHAALTNYTSFSSTKAQNSILKILVSQQQERTHKTEQPDKKISAVKLPPMKLWQSGWDHTTYPIYTWRVSSHACCLFSPSTILICSIASTLFVCCVLLQLTYELSFPRFSHLIATLIDTYLFSFPLSYVWSGGMV